MTAQDAAVSQVPQRSARTTSGLEPYRGPWDSATAAHLLRRAMFGAGRSQIAAVAGGALNGTVDSLLADQPSPLPPVDPTTGTTWVTSPFDSSNESRYSTYLRAWWIGLMATEQLSIREKMVLFWHNHFASEYATVQDSRVMYRQNELLRQNALGNARDLVTSVSIDPAMLVYLNGYRSRGDGSFIPDENYARELQELFTIGKGPQKGPDDYTFYTESDVKAASRVLSGWRLTGYRGTQTAEITSYFDPTRHDMRDKQFSPAYQNTVIRGGVDGPRELNDLVAMIFRQDETARHLCRKIYRWFVYSEIDSFAEENVIEPLAKIMRESNYEVRPVISALLRSAHFFDPNNVGSQIKNPVELVVGSLRALDIQVPSPASQTAAYYSLMASLRGTASNLQMNLLDPPSVAGWEAYHQEPEFHRLWLNTATLPGRWGCTDSLVNGLRFGTTRITADSAAIARQLPGAGDPYSLVEGLAENLFSMKLSGLQRDRLVYDVLLPGLPDYEWTIEWVQYAADPANARVREPVVSKLNALLKYMMRMAQFQLT